MVAGAEIIAVDVREPAHPSRFAAYRSKEKRHGSGAISCARGGARFRTSIEAMKPLLDEIDLVFLLPANSDWGEQ